jgi:hypothetical protein
MELNRRAGCAGDRAGVGDRPAPRANLDAFVAGNCSEVSQRPGTDENAKPTSRRNDRGFRIRGTPIGDAAAFGQVDACSIRGADDAEIGHRATGQGGEGWTLSAFPIYSFRGLAAHLLHITRSGKPAASEVAPLPPTVVVMTLAERTELIDMLIRTRRLHEILRDPAGRKVLEGVLANLVSKLAAMT